MIFAHFSVTLLNSLLITTESTSENAEKNTPTPKNGDKNKPISDKTRGLLFDLMFASFCICSSESSGSATSQVRIEVKAAGSSSRPISIILSCSKAGEPSMLSSGALIDSAPNLSVSDKTGLLKDRYRILYPKVNFFSTLFAFYRKRNKKRNLSCLSDKRGFVWCRG